MVRNQVLSDIPTTEPTSLFSTFSHIIALLSFVMGLAVWLVRHQDRRINEFDALVAPKLRLIITKLNYIMTSIKALKTLPNTNIKASGLELSTKLAEEMSELDSLFQDVRDLYGQWRVRFSIPASWINLEDWQQMHDVILDIPNVIEANSINQRTMQDGEFNEECDETLANIEKISSFHSGIMGRAEKLTIFQHRPIYAHFRK